MDFVHGQLATVKNLRVLTVVDTFSRYVPVLDVRYSYRVSVVPTPRLRAGRCEAHRGLWSFVDRQ